MSNSADYTDTTGHTSAFYQGVEAGKAEEYERIIKVLESEMPNACYCSNCKQTFKLFKLIKETK